MPCLMNPTDGENLAVPMPTGDDRVSSKLQVTRYYCLLYMNQSNNCSAYSVVCIDVRLDIMSITHAGLTWRCRARLELGVRHKIASHHLIHRPSLSSPSKHSPLIDLMSRVPKLSPKSPISLSPSPASPIDDFQQVNLLRLSCTNLIF